MKERILMTGLDTEHAHFREDSCEAVSYTHLDVYKRQAEDW